MKAEHEVGKLAFSSDGRKLIVNDELWRLSPLGRVTQRGDEARFGAALSFSPDGGCVASVVRSEDGAAQLGGAELRVWRFDEGGLGLVSKHRIVAKLAEGFWHSTIWSPSESHLAVVSGEVLIVVSDPKERPRETLIVHPSLMGGDVNGLGRLVGGFPTHVAGVAFSPDEKTLAVAFHQKGVLVFGLPGLDRIVDLPFPGAVGDWEWSLGLDKSTVGYTADGRLLVTKQERRGRRDETGRWINSSASLAVWDTSNWEPARITKADGDDRESAEGFVGLTPAERCGLIFSQHGGDPRVLRWDAGSGRSVETIRPPLIGDRTTRLAWNRNGSVIMLDQVQGPIQIWGVDPVRPLAHILDELAEHRRASTISPDGRLIATGYPNGEVAIWDFGTAGGLESISGLAVEADRIRRQDQEEKDRKDEARPFTSTEATVDDFLAVVRGSGEVKNPRKGLPILVASKHDLHEALGEPTNVVSSVRDRKGTHEVLDYACSDGRVLVSVTYDMAGAWIETVAPLRGR